MILLKVILWIYIILCVAIAGLNYGYVKSAPPAVATAITWTWHFYENWVKTAFIVVASILTIRVVGKTKRTRMRKRNLIGFILASLVVHIFTPIIINNSELYMFAMPLSWTAAPLKLLFEDSSFYVSRFPGWGVTGILLTLIFYAIVSCVVLVGTLLFGRRWQCSTICLFNGFASEVFAPIFPLVGKKKKVGPKVLRILVILKWVMLAVAVFFTVYWVLLLAGAPVTGVHDLISTIENYKYLTAELLMMMSFWIVFTGRGYCYYCPLGTVLGGISRISGQSITTDHAKCIGCNQCNIACPMTIDIKGKAMTGEPVTLSRCVGCGHCVDTCPTQTLQYSTSFTRRIRSGKPGTGSNKGAEDQ